MPLLLADPANPWNIVPSITDPWKLAAFAIAAVLTVVLMLRRQIVPRAFWIIILLLVIIPIGASVYQDLVKAKSSNDTIYRVRVTVIGMEQIPVEDAKVWSSFGGEPKKVAGGWQFDIPAASRPQDGKLEIFASQEDSSLIGKSELQLDRDYNPAVTIQLTRNEYKVRGQVVDRNERAIAGARVFVVGYETEAVITKEGGNFELPAHAAVNQSVLLYAEKDGLAIKQVHQAGDYPAILKLTR